jgi:hypothetical protein
MVNFDKLLSVAMSDLLPLYTEMPGSRSNAPPQWKKMRFSEKSGEIPKRPGEKTV